VAVALEFIDIQYQTTEDFSYERHCLSYETILESSWLPA